eukprot:jgi/Picre1/30948/NNA_006307.t1
MSNSTLEYDVDSLTVEQYFGYFPSLALAGTATGLYYAAALIVTAQLIYKRNRNAWFMLLVVLTALAEAGGYVAMIWMVKNSGQASLFSAYVAMQCLIVLSPNVLQAASYTTVGKISTIAKMHTKSKFLKPKAISWGFVGLDLFALIVQAVGISIWATQKVAGILSCRLSNWEVGLPLLDWDCNWFHFAYLRFLRSGFRGIKTINLGDTRRTSGYFWACMGRYFLSQ